MSSVFSVVCILVLFVLPAWAQLSQGGVVRGFKLPMFYEPVPGKVPPNRLKVLVTGAEAEPLSRDLVSVKEMRLQDYLLDGRTNVIAQAPHCLLNRQLQQATSTGRVQIITGDGRVSLEGNSGFFCRLTNSNLIVSNHVRTVIQHLAITNVP